MIVLTGTLQVLGLLFFIFIFTFLIPKAIVAIVYALRMEREPTAEPPPLSEEDKAVLAALEREKEHNKREARKKAVIGCRFKRRPPPRIQLVRGPRYSSLAPRKETRPKYIIARRMCKAPYYEEGFTPRDLKITVEGLQKFALFPKDVPVQIFIKEFVEYWEDKGYLDVYRE